MINPSINGWITKYFLDFDSNKIENDTLFYDKLRNSGIVYVDSGLQAWQLDVSNRSAPLVGFDGKLTTAALQASAWKATFTPTVLFLGRQGQELAERLVGIAVPDFYGAYLEQRLATASKAL